MKKTLQKPFRRCGRLILAWLFCLAGSTGALAQCANHALDFDGVDDVVTATITSTLAADFTFEAWVTSTAGGSGCGGLNNFRRLFHMRDPGLAPNMIDIGECNGYVTIGWIDPFNHGPFQTTAFIGDNLWHHIAMVKTTGEILVYVDCNLVFTASSVGSSVGTFNINAVALGGNTLSAPHFWQGRVDEVRVWPSARTAMEICDARFCPAPPKGLRIYWAVDEGIPAGYNSSSGIQLDNQGIGATDGVLSNFLLQGPSSNFVCSQAPVNYPNYFPLRIQIKDALNQNPVTQLCSGAEAHFCLVNTNGTPPAPAPNTMISWEQSDDNGAGFGPFVPETSGALSSTDFCFVVPKDNLVFDCATTTRGFVDRRYRALISVTQNGHTCEFFTPLIEIRICCPVTDVAVQLTVTPGTLLNGTFCEGDPVIVDVALSSATHHFINPPGDELSIIWAPPFSSHNGHASFTENLTLGADDLCAAATITNCACAQLDVSACVPVDPVPKCGALTGLPMPMPANLMPDPDADPAHYLICPGDDAALGMAMPFLDCVPHWEYSFDLVGWTDLGISNTEQNTNILPTALWTGNCIYYRIECQPYSDPSGCDPCYCAPVRICLKPDPLMPVITGDDLICKADGSSLLLVQAPESGVTYTWYCNGQEVSVGTHLNADMEACYRVKADNGCVAVLSDPFCLKICEVFAIISCPLAPNECVEPGLPIELSGGDSYSTCGGDIATYAWSSNNTTLSGPTDLSNLMDTPDMNGTTYTLTVTDQNGCTDTKSTFVKPCKL